MKGPVLLLLLSMFYHPIIAQPAFIASEDNSEATNLIFNPDWIKSHRVKEIIFDRYYVNQPKGKPSNTTTLVFDSSGYQAAEYVAENTDHPDEQSFATKKLIRYLIYGHALIKSVQTFGRNKTDTLERFPDTYTLAGNPERLNEMVIGPDTVFYQFDEFNRPASITQAGSGNIKTIQYDKEGRISKIRQTFSNSKPGPYCEYEYTAAGQIKSVRLKQGSRWYMKVLYEYDEKGFPLKSVTYLGNFPNMILQYRYRFE